MDKTLTELEEEMLCNKKRLTSLKRKIQRNVQWINGTNQDVDDALQHQLRINELERLIIVKRAQPSFM